MGEISLMMDSTLLSRRQGLRSHHHAGQATQGHRSASARPPDPAMIQKARSLGKDLFAEMGPEQRGRPAWTFLGK